MNCYILHAVLLVIILLFVIMLCYYLLLICKTLFKTDICITVLTRRKWKIITFKKFVLRIVSVIILITNKFENFGFGNFLIDENSYKNILI